MPMGTSPGLQDRGCWSHLCSPGPRAGLDSAGEHRDRVSAGWGPRPGGLTESGAHGAATAWYPATTSLRWFPWQRRATAARSRAYVTRRCPSRLGHRHRPPTDPMGPTNRQQHPGVLELQPTGIAGTKPRRPSALSRGTSPLHHHMDHGPQPAPPGLPGPERAQEPPSWWCRREGREVGIQGWTRHSSGIPGARLRGTLTPRLEGVKCQGRGVPGDNALPAPAGDHFAAEGLVQPLPSSCHRICARCRQRQAGPRSPARAGLTLSPTRHRHGPAAPRGDTSRPRGTRTLPVPPHQPGLPMPPAQPRASSTGAGRGRAAAWERRCEQSRAELCQVSIPALSCPLPRDRST